MQHIPPPSSEADALVASWTEQLDSLTRRLGPLFARSETRERMAAYLRGLLSPVERKNGWQLAEHLGHATPYGLQHLLDRAVWDADALRDRLRDYVLEHLADPEAIGVLDETGFVKKGTKSVGVARQYSGTAGRIENSQVGVFLAYSTARGHTFLDRELYLPQEWTQAPLRCRQAGVPPEIGFATKPQLARQILQRAFEAGVSLAWISADSVYGNDRRLRLWLEERRQPYVLAVSGQESVTVALSPVRVKELLALIPEDAWQTLSAGEGAKGPRLYEWTRCPLTHPYEPAWQRWLLVRRSLSDPAELTAYVVFAPADTPLETLVRVAGTRWTIESSFESAKSEVGLDQYEVRSWHGWYRHITLAMVAHAFLSVMRAQAIERPAQKGALPAAEHSLAAFKRQRGLSSA